MNMELLCAAPSTSRLANEADPALVVEAPSSAGTQANASSSSAEKQQPTTEECKVVLPEHGAPFLKAEERPATVDDSQPERAALEVAVVDTLVKEEPCEAQGARTTPVTLMLGADEEEASPTQQSSTSPKYEPPSSPDAVIPAGTPPPPRALPPPGTSFASKQAFLDACRLASLDSSGWPTYTSLNQPHFTVAVCQRVRLRDCRMKVSARLEEATGAWRVEKDGWVGWHAHPTRQEMEGGKTSLSEEEMQAREEEAEPERKPKAEVEEAEEPEEEEETADTVSPVFLQREQEEASYEAQQEQKPTSSRKINYPGVMPRIPGFPSVGARFPSVDSAISLARATSIPVTGINIMKEQLSGGRHRAACKLGAWGATTPRCPAALVFEQQTDGMWQVTTESDLEHNHGPDKRIIDDPKWRPNIKGRTPYNERREMQMYNELMAEAPLKPKVASPRTPREQAPKKRASVDAPTAAHPSDPRKARLSAPTATATVARPSPSPSIVQPGNHAARHSLPAQAPQLPPPRRTPTPAQPKPFVSSLSSFLLSLHPSLPPIAPLLFSAGVSDHERLTHFIGLQETTREKFLLAAGVGPLQRGMIKGRLKGAKARGWAVEA